jgi:hypothetical protein
MTIREFLAHSTPGKSRVFAIDSDRPQFLEAVTSLGADDLHRTDELLDGLNFFLITRDEDALGKLLTEFPEAVRVGVRDFLAHRCPPPPLGSFGEYGPIEQVRLIYLGGGEDLEEFVQAAYLVGLGIRLSNEVDKGGVGWRLELLNEEAFVPAGAEPRTWALPASTPLLSTWISKFAKGDAVTEAVELAVEASADGHWVRLHTFEHDGRSELRVDVFDVPPPVMEEA